MVVVDLTDCLVNPGSDDGQDTEDDRGVVHLERKSEQGQEDHHGSVRDDVAHEAQDLAEERVRSNVHTGVETDEGPDERGGCHSWDQSRERGDRVHPDHVLPVAWVRDHLAKALEELGPGRDGGVVAEVRDVGVHAEDREDRQREEHVLLPLGKRFPHGSHLTQGFAPAVFSLHLSLHFLLIG